MIKHQTNLGALYNTLQKFQGHEKKKKEKTGKQLTD